MSWKRRDELRSYEFHPFLHWMVVVFQQWASTAEFYPNPMRLKSGIVLLQEREGEGEPAERGNRVVYNVRIFLNKGDEVPLNQRQSQYLPAGMIRTVDGCQYVDHKTVLGSRQAIAGVEYSLIGMKQGGYRKVRISPHLAYRSEGLPGLIPADAVLIAELWLREITR